MNMNDNANGQPIVWQSDLSGVGGHKPPQQSPAEQLPDDCDIFALMPPPQQMIWTRVWPDLSQARSGIVRSPPSLPAGSGAWRAGFQRGRRPTTPPPAPPSSA